MSGPEHYQQAEHQLAAAERSVNDPCGPLAAAQVHALLALTAAFAPIDPQSRPSAAISLAWAKATRPSFADLSSEGR